MLVAGIILAAIILFFIIISFSSILIVIDFSHRKDDDHFKVQLRFWKFIRYNINVPTIKVEEDQPNIEYKKQTSSGNKEHTKVTPKDIHQRISDLQELLEHVAGMNKIFKKFLKTIRIKKFEWHTLVGLGDAASTGVLTGAVWTMKGGILAFLSHYMKMKAKPNCSVVPSFQIPVSQTFLTCIFKIRIGNAILTGFKVLKYWRGGKGSFKTEPLSMVSDDDSKPSAG
ncbi:DUF2953 domain-containing protein [Heyndrickxia acidicola]|uniref:DUF2953 domain-containing protein n=1 Tax=Heyndrickxia acidicola TaxID=209389 RepID=A0ABU6MJG7_9BACI|nr:DUF2953 domain-containing protein [Heyndrickxia acidicola]MED1203190.1 DUF2953 domain-containing protein [Heyndrickxia acidicola]